MKRFVRVLGWALAGLALSVGIGAVRVYVAARSLDEGGDPSQKARALAQGISEAMNFAACAAIVGLVVGVGVGVVRSRRPPNPPAGGA